MPMPMLDQENAYEYAEVSAEREMECERLEVSEWQSIHAGSRRIEREGKGMWFVVYGGCMMGAGWVCDRYTMVIR